MYSFRDRNTARVERMIEAEKREIMYIHLDDSGERISAPRAHGVVALRSVRNEQMRAYNTYFFFSGRKKTGPLSSFATPTVRLRLAHKVPTFFIPEVNGLRNIHISQRTRRYNIIYYNAVCVIYIYAHQNQIIPFPRDKSDADIL